MAKRKITKESKLPQESESSDEESVPDVEILSSDDNGSSSSEEGDSGSEAEVVESDYDSNEEISSSDDEDDDDDEFEDQGSSDEEDDLLAEQIKAARLEDEEEESDVEKAGAENLKSAESEPRQFIPSKETSQFMHTDDLSSDEEDDDGNQNRIGRVPLHWYDEYDHIGYNVHGTKIGKPSASEQGDLLDKAIAQADSEGKPLTVYDALNAREVEVTPRQLEIIRRIQAGAYAHPEFDGNADLIDYFSGVNKEVSGLNANRDPPKRNFQPSEHEKRQVRKLLHQLKCGGINMDFLTGKIKTMEEGSKKNKKEDESDQPFMLWNGDEEDELNLRKGPMHIAAPKQPPPVHAESYNPAEEYLPTEQDLKDWAEMDVKDRPYGLLIPKKHKSLREVGAYEHSVRERFERCLDLYLCPRVMKRRLNIDPESLVPSIPRARDLRPFPTTQCIRYKTPYKEGEEPPMIRCISVSHNGQFLCSGATDGFVRLWEVATGRLLRSWNVSKLVSVIQKDLSEESESSNEDIVLPIVNVKWNPNSSYHCLLAAVGSCAVVISTGTGGSLDAEITGALLSVATSGKQNVTTEKASKSVDWISTRSFFKKNKKYSKMKELLPISSFGDNGRGDRLIGPICLLRTKSDISNIRWHRKGDYFVSVSPKAGASSVLIHQLSKANSQQPFGKTPKVEIQCACFHPSKPFLFVASTQDVKIYHLIKQVMVKRLLSGCKWISSIDVHSTGDHVIIGSLDRRVVWFDLDLSNTPYKTLKYHTRAVRNVNYHRRYPLMATCSDDGTVHVFHSTVYTDLMRNPLIVPVKILRGHSIVNKFGILAFEFHPSQPWLFSAGADGMIHLFQDI